MHPLLAKKRRFRLPDPTLMAPVTVPFEIIDRGACTTSAQPAVFDVDDRRVDPEAAATAQELCGLCPVRRACLTYAMTNEPFGFWGGLDAFERLAVRDHALPDADERHAAEEIRIRLRSGTPAATIAEEYGVSRRTIERWKRAGGIWVNSTKPDRPPVGECELAA